MRQREASAQARAAELLARGLAVVGKGKEKGKGKGEVELETFEERKSRIEELQAQWLRREISDMVGSPHGATNQMSKSKSQNATKTRASTR